MAGVNGWYSAIGWNQPGIASTGTKALERSGSRISGSALLLAASAFGMTKVAASVGLTYDFDALQHTNTRKAHQALHLAKAHGLQPEMKERLLRAYFVEGRHVGHDEDLADLATDVGLDRQVALAALRQGTYADDVDDDIRQGWAYGISGVPFFVIDQRYGISGAQDPNLFARTLAQSADESQVQA